MKSFKVEDAWVAEYDDTEWFPGDDEYRKNVVDQARSVAKENKCRSFSIFVIPDPLFPVHGITQRKRVHTEQIDTGTAFKLSCTHHAEIPRDHWSSLDDAGKEKLKSRIRDVMEIKMRTNPGRYEIITPNGDGTYEYLERGVS